MDLMTVVLAGALLAAFTAIQTWINNGRFARIDHGMDQLRSDISALRAENRAEFASVRSEIASVRTELGSEIASVRSDLTQVALAVGARMRPQTG